MLIVAPHGGRRRRRHRLTGGSAPKVNDLHTAELAGDLAARLDASMIVNGTMDRNEIDLNRISQVRRRAGWFLQLLDQMLTAILAHHGVAEVVFVHGWNVTQIRCDIGIGAPLRDEDGAAEHAGLLTVAPVYVAQRLRTLREYCAAEQIVTTYGDRYPARHANNVLQLFRHQPPLGREPASESLRRLATAGRVHAVQLELGVPVRWPGPIRDRFLAAATAAFSDSATVHDPPCPVREEAGPATPHVLQFYDATARVGLMAGVGPRGAGTTGARLLVLLGNRAVALFTGEESGRRAVHGAPIFLPTETGFSLSFEGPLIRLDDGRLYVDLEAALAASYLSTASVAVTFVPGAVPAYGRVTGVVRVGNDTFSIDTYGFADPRLIRRLGTHPRQATLSAAFGGHGAILARFGEAGATGTFTRIDNGAATTSTFAAMTVRFDGDPLGPDRLSFSPTDGPSLVAHVVSRMAIVQPTPSGTARITFGVARFALGSQLAGFGFYEYARLAHDSGAHEQ